MILIYFVVKFPHAIYKFLIKKQDNIAFEDELDQENFQRKIYHTAAQKNVLFKLRSKFFALYEGIRYSNKYALIYQVVFLCRRLVLSLVIVWLNEFPTLQLIFVVLMNMFYIIYIELCRPFLSS